MNGLSQKRYLELPLPTEDDPRSFLLYTSLEYIDSCETSSPIIYKKGRKGNDIKSGTAEYT